MNTAPAQTPTALKDLQASAPATKRITAIDALRGFDMFWILGADDMVYALKAVGGGAITTGLAAQLSHKEWRGFTFYDMIFPLFVFLVGVSLVFSLTRSLQLEGKGRTYWKIVRRFLILYVLALFYYGGFANSWPDAIRLVGVLNRIAICYLCAALIFCNFNWKAIAGICAASLVVYWALMSFVPFPDVRPGVENGSPVTGPLAVRRVSELDFKSEHRLRGVFEPGLNLAHYVDQKYLPGKKWDGTWDPEGILSTIPAIGTCLLGVLAGLLLQTKNIDDKRKVQILMFGGALMVVLGFLWGLQFPVIKKIWTSSYVLVAGGYSAILLGFFYLVIEVFQIQSWAKIFIWIGANAITLYMVHNMVDLPKLASRLVGGHVRDYLDLHVVKGLGEVAIAATVIAFTIVLARFLYKRKIFLRI
jgi:predicted acyltransferase